MTLIAGVELVSIEQRHGFNVGFLNEFPQYDLLLWDSLFWDELHALSKVLHTRPCGLLCHYLPSLKPNLTVAQRHSLLHKEQQVLSAMQLVITTGVQIKSILQARFPNLSVHCCIPGVDPVFIRKRIRPKLWQGEMALLTVANILPEKGFLDLLAVVKNLSGLPWCWHIIGSADLNIEFNNEFRNRARKLISSGNICIYAPMQQEKLAQFMDDMDIFIFASHFESYGMVLAEAVANGLPVLSTRVGAAEQLIVEGKNGFIAAVGDRQQLLSRLTQLMKQVSEGGVIADSHVLPVRSWTSCTRELHAILQQYGNQ